MSREALATWLRERHPGLLAQINMKTPQDAVASLNWITELHLKYEAGHEDEICGQFLNAMKGNKPMANSIQEISQYEWESQRAKELAYAHAQMNALTKSQAYSVPPPIQPITNPEPNKVLLLLGEDA
jgi:hypothetical protein